MWQVYKGEGGGEGSTRTERDRREGLWVLPPTIIALRTPIPRTRRTPLLEFQPLLLLLLILQVIKQPEEMVEIQAMDTLLFKKTTNYKIVLPDINRPTCMSYAGYKFLLILHSFI